MWALQFHLILSMQNLCKNLCVIIPFYNEKTFLEESITRVLHDDIYDQIILSDDCSNDGSELIAKSFSDKYEKIFIY